MLRIKGAPRGSRHRPGPLGAGYLKGALRLTFHMAMKSWNNKAARSAEKCQAKATGGNKNGAEREATRTSRRQKQREATGGNKNGAESEATRDQQEAKA